MLANILIMYMGELTASSGTNPVAAEQTIRQ